MTTRGKEHLNISSLSLVHRFHKGEVTPVVTEVSEFMLTLLDGGIGASPDPESDYRVENEEMAFRVLRVPMTFQASQLLHFLRFCKE